MPDAPGDRPAWAARLDAHPERIIPVAPQGDAMPQDAPEPPRSGILNIDKPAGPTSHDVVQLVRRASGVRRVGHAGTLDPMATGVLVVCIGSATRLVEDVQAGDKCYRAQARLGVVTTTYDTEGEVVSECDADAVSRADVETALEGFRGKILQVPPMFAALRHDGRHLYDLARRGIEVDRVPRPVTVHGLELVDWAPPEATFELRVSKGTYVRSLVHDLGQRLGVGAHLVGLVRTAVGPFTIDQASSLDEVTVAFAEGWWPTLLHALDTVLLDLPVVVVDARGEADLRHGLQIDGPPPVVDAQAPTAIGAAPVAGARLRGRARVYDVRGGFVGLVRWDDVTRRWQPDRVFPTAP